MKARYRMFRRGRVFYVEDSVTGKQASLKTNDKDEAWRLLNARNEAERQPAINLQIARSYLLASDVGISTRTWTDVMNEAARTKMGPPKLRWNTAMREAPFDIIRKFVVIETRAEHFLRVLSIGTVSTMEAIRRHVEGAAAPRCGHNG